MTELGDAALKSLGLHLLELDSSVQAYSAAEEELNYSINLRHKQAVLYIFIHTSLMQSSNSINISSSADD